MTWTSLPEPGMNDYYANGPFDGTEELPDTCPSCGSDITSDCISIDIGNEVYHAACAAEIWAEALDLEVRHE